MSNILTQIEPQLHNSQTPFLTEKDAVLPMIADPVTNKPAGSLWTSAAVKTDNGKYTSSWIDWCREEQFRIHPYNFLIIPKKEVKLFVIDSYEDLKQMHLKESELSKEMPSTRRAMPWQIIDFDWYASHGFDGIHATQAAVWDCGFFDFKEHKARPVHLSTWDVESTCWFSTRWIESYEDVNI